MAWIRRDDSWNTFVGNRTREINRLSKPEDWRHVPGELNPADLPSRGCSPSYLLKSRWWEGPAWLYKFEENEGWIAQIDEHEVAKEKRKSEPKPVVSMTLIDFEQKQRPFAGWVRVVAYLRRFIYNCRSREKRFTGVQLTLCVAWKTSISSPAN